MTDLPTCDLLVVGGGPAGLATALAAKRSGLERVTVLDGRRPPIDKACGEGLMPDGVARLEALGVTLPRGRCAPFTGIRYLDGTTVADGSFPSGAAGGVGLGVRRTLLHGAMVEAAEAAGVELRWGVKATGLLPGTLLSGEDAAALGIGVETDAGPVTARWVAAADGLSSPTRSWAGLDEPPARAGRRPRRLGVRRHFWATPWSDKVEVYWGEGAEAYVTPVGAHEVGVAFLTAGESAHFEELMGRFPALAARLEGAEIASRAQGRGPLEHRVSGVIRGRLALVGDASGYVDAITGEGLSLAFHQAGALASALSAGSLAPYARAHRRIGRLPDRLTRVLLAIERRPALRRRLVRALSDDGPLFDRLLAVHSRALPLAGFGLGNAARLAWRLLRSAPAAAPAGPGGRSTPSSRLPEEAGEPRKIAT